MDPKKERDIEETFWHIYGRVVLFVCVIAAFALGPGLFRLCWHYLLCSLCLNAGWKLSRSGRRRAAFLLAALSACIACVGFFLVFFGPFVESGKTFQMYLTRYGLYTLSIFLFPAVGFLLAFRSKK